MTNKLDWKLDLYREERKKWILICKEHLRLEIQNQWSTEGVKEAMFRLKKFSDLRKINTQLSDNYPDLSREINDTKLYILGELVKQKEIFSKIEIHSLKFKTKS